VLSLDEGGVGLERLEHLGVLLVGEGRLLLGASEVELLNLAPVLLVRLLGSRLRESDGDQTREQSSS